GNPNSRNPGSGGRYRVQLAFGNRNPLVVTSNLDRVEQPGLIRWRTQVFRTWPVADLPKPDRGGAPRTVRPLTQVRYRQPTPLLLVTRQRIRHESEPKRSEEHTSELQSRENLVCRLLRE